MCVLSVHLGVNVSVVGKKRVLENQHASEGEERKDEVERKWQENSHYNEEADQLVEVEKYARHKSQDIAVGVFVHVSGIFSNESDVVESHTARQQKVKVCEDLLHEDGSVVPEPRLGGDKNRNYVFHLIGCIHTGLAADKVWLQNLKLWFQCEITVALVCVVQCAWNLNAQWHDLLG